MVSALANKETDYAVTIIQFSGVKKLEASYIPGSLGASGRVSKVNCNSEIPSAIFHSIFEPNLRS